MRMHFRDFKGVYKRMGAASLQCRIFLEMHNLRCSCVQRVHNTQRFKGV